MIRALKLLLVEDNPGDARLFRESLRDAELSGLDLDHATSLKQATSFLERTEYDLIVLDLGLPDSFGLETLRSIRSRSADSVMVVLSGQADQELALASITNGAQDYLPKSNLSPDVLNRIIRYSLVRHTLTARSRLLSQVVEETSTGIAMMARDGTISYLNKACREFPVFSDSEGPVSCPEDQKLPFIQAIIEQAEETFRGGERRVCRLETGMFAEWATYLECTTYLQDSPSRGPQSCVIQLVDITEQTLAMQRLLLVEKMETAGFMAGSVAHDFNNQLAIMTGHLEIMGEMLSAGGILEHFNACMTAVETAQQKTRELLAIAGRQSTQPGTLNLNALIESSLRTSMRGFQEFNPLKWKVPDEPLFVRIDEVQMDFVVASLLGSRLDQGAVPGQLYLEMSRTAIELPDSGDTQESALLLFSHTEETAPSGWDGTPFEELESPEIAENHHLWKVAVSNGIMKQNGGRLGFWIDPSGRPHFQVEMPSVPTP